MSPRPSCAQDTEANILGGAAVLRSHADALGLDDGRTARHRRLVPGRGPLQRAPTAPSPALYADTVYTFLAQGVRAAVAGGELVTVTSRPVAPEQRPLARPPDVDRPEPGLPRRRSGSPPTPPTSRSGRTAAIDKVVIHVTQGSYAGTISWFQNPTSKVSAHYVVRSSDGQITQMVRDKDTACHAKSANASVARHRARGVRRRPVVVHRRDVPLLGRADAYLCDRYGIPKDRAHIIGHSEVPGNDHTDPGANWNWTYYMQLVGGSSGSGGRRARASRRTTTQRTGSTGTQVTAVQTLLNKQGYDAGTEDGIFGAKTETAVTAFQNARGLGADGVVGAEVPGPRCSRPARRRRSAGRLGRGGQAAPAGADRRAGQNRGGRRSLRCEHGQGRPRLPERR